MPLHICTSVVSMNTTTSVYKTAYFLGHWTVVVNIVPRCFYECTESWIIRDVKKEIIENVLEKFQVFFEKIILVERKKICQLFPWCKLLIAVANILDV